MKRPKGVTVIAVFFMVGATVLPAFVLLSPVRITTFSKPLLMLMSLSEFVLAMGLWKMKNWARVSSGILAIVGFLSGVASLRHPPHSRGFRPWWLAEHVLVFGIDLLMIVYLLSPSVRQAFQTRSEHDAVEWKP